jgi:tetratricopeptide (TPR) repeat protein
MILGKQGAPGARHGTVLSVLLLALVSLALLATACAKKEAGKEAGAGAAKGTTAAVSDTTAYKDARAVADTTARITAWESFLATYPASSFRPRVTAAYCGLLMAKDTAKLAAFVSKSLATEKDPATRGQLHYAAYQYAQAHANDQLPGVLKAMKDDPLIETDACNMVGWDLVERNQMLDDAIALAALGASKATDNARKSSVLDTQGWAHFAKGEYPRAVEVLVEAVGLDPSNSEVKDHLAQAYGKAGQPKKAVETYSELLIPAEEPEYRTRIEALAKAAGEPAKAVFQRIDKIREANAKPAAAFGLKDYAGKEIKLADFKGQVVLLNFWHPT